MHAIASICWLVLCWWSNDEMFVVAVVVVTPKTNNFHIIANGSVYIISAHFYLSSHSQNSYFVLFRTLSAHYAHHLYNTTKKHKNKHYAAGESTIDLHFMHSNSFIQRILPFLRQNADVLSFSVAFALSLYSLPHSIVQRCIPI